MAPNAGGDFDLLVSYDFVDVKGRDGQVLPLDDGPGRITVVGGGMPPTPVGEPSVLLLFAAGLATIARRPKRA